LKDTLLNAVFYSKHYHQNIRDWTVVTYTKNFYIHWLSIHCEFTVPDVTAWSSSTIPDYFTVTLEVSGQNLGISTRMQ